MTHTDMHTHKTHTNNVHGVQRTGRWRASLEMWAVFAVLSSKVKAFESAGPRWLKAPLKAADLIPGATKKRLCEDLSFFVYLFVYLFGSPLAAEKPQLFFLGSATHLSGLMGLDHPPPIKKKKVPIKYICGLQKSKHKYFFLAAEPVEEWPPHANVCRKRSK